MVNTEGDEAEDVDIDTETTNVFEAVWILFYRQ